MTMILLLLCYVSAGEAHFQAAMAREDCEISLAMAFHEVLSPSQKLALYVTIMVAVLAWPLFPVLGFFTNERRP